VRKEARTTGAIGPSALVLMDEREELVSRDAVRPRRPVGPPVGRLDRRPEQAPREGGLLLTLPLQVIQELEEHDPGEQGEAVEVAVEAFIFAHNVAPTSRGCRGIERWSEAG